MKRTVCTADPATGELSGVQTDSCPADRTYGSRGEEPGIRLVKTGLPYFFQDDDLRRRDGGHDERAA